MGIFDKKTDEEKALEKRINGVLGGFLPSDEVMELCEKYDRGGVLESEAMKQVKKEAREGKILPEECLSRFEELLSKFPSKEEDKQIKQQDKLQKDKEKEVQTQKALIDQNKSLIRQMELQQRSLDELKETNKEILELLKTSLK